ncbi:MOSC domain-containing protein [Candidatus Poriferisodalis sp.]|uniref:MOSC domain-containing protein n=1 Tax=Candidatus Poriferisodalis sp. TaxID=3101277 RepID=UPI003B0258CC
MTSSGNAGSEHAGSGHDGGTLTGITIHPIKGCRRIELESVTVSAAGLDGDREWQVVTAPDEDGVIGEAVTQRQSAVLATVVPVPIDGGLTISASDIGTIDVKRPDANDVTVHALIGDEVACADAGDEAAAFFSEVLGMPARLAALTPESSRPVRLFRGRLATFADAAPVLVANMASLDDLVARAIELFGIERFRANLIVTNDEPWSEDTWTEFSIGDADLVARIAWPRCAVPQIDQDTGERHREPALVMRKHRWCYTAEGHSPGMRKVLEGNAIFGIACTIDPEGTVLNVGDPVAVTQTGPALLGPPFRLLPADAAS